MDKEISYGPRQCYKCKSESVVYSAKNKLLKQVYNVQCSNPKCDNTTNRNYVNLYKAVEAWNRKPTIEDLIYDLLFSKIIRKLEGS